jgi:beta-galactosidase
LWSGIDYLGEAGKWPNISRPTGLLDRMALPHPRAWERQSWWAAAPSVHIARRIPVPERSAANPAGVPAQPALQEPLLLDWTPSNTAPHSESVEVYTNCEEAELFLNGQSLGRQKLHADASPLTWSVPYSPGSLKAVAYNRGSQAAEDELRTAGKAARLVLSSERTTVSSSGEDALTIVVTAVDEAGVPAPDELADVQFTVSGPAQILGTDNGSDTDHEPFLSPHHHLHDGRAIAILHATASSGAIVLRASAAGLADGEIRLSAVPGGSSQSRRAF